jgi:thioredoxin-related protein
VTNKEFNNHNVSAEQMQRNAPASAHKKSSRPLVIIFLVFIAFIIIVFLIQQKVTIDWIENYQTGIELAEQQNKPIFIAFYKSYIPSNIKERIYSNRSVKEYIEATFIPILIDAAQEPDIAKLYNVKDYPAHYVKQPDSNDVFGPFGYRPPRGFINQLKGVIKQMGLPAE